MVRKLIKGFPKDDGRLYLEESHWDADAACVVAVVKKNKAVATAPVIAKSVLRGGINSRTIAFLFCVVTVLSL